MALRLLSINTEHIHMLLYRRIGHHRQGDFNATATTLIPGVSKKVAPHHKTFLEYFHFCPVFLHEILQWQKALLWLQHRDVNTRVLGYPGPVWPTRVPTRVLWNQRSAQLPRSPSSKHWLPVWPHTDWTVGCSRKRGAYRVLIACW